jgi:hypothetical protein
MRNDYYWDEGGLSPFEAMMEEQPTAEELYPEWYDIYLLAELALIRLDTAGFSVAGSVVKQVGPIAIPPYVVIIHRRVCFTLVPTWEIGKPHSFKLERLTYDLPWKAVSASWEELVDLIPVTSDKYLTATDKRLASLAL